MERLTVGSVILVRFPFSDMRSRKYRPALIVAVAEFDNVIVCQITSSKFGKKNIINLNSGDFSKGRLPVDSFIRPDKLFTLDKKLALQNLGSVNRRKLDEVLLALRKLFAKNKPS